MVPGQVSAGPPPILPPPPPAVQEQDVEMSIVPGQVAAEPPPVRPPPPPPHAMQGNAVQPPPPVVEQAGQALERYTDLCQHFEQVSALPTCYHLSYTCSRWPKR
ncbi:MAG TPA: hypothetical protein VGO47_12970 [Chlamydiales bacterium]|nr:hypothetical protein [Chlamydiales bacterium]